MESAPFLAVLARPVQEELTVLRAQDSKIPSGECFTRGQRSSYANGRNQEEGQWKSRGAAKCETRETRPAPFEAPKGKITVHRQRRRGRREQPSRSWPGCDCRKGCREAGTNFGEVWEASSGSGTVAYKTLKREAFLDLPTSSTNEHQACHGHLKT